MNRITRVASGATLIAVTLLLGACGREDAPAGGSATQKPPSTNKCGYANTEAFVAPGSAPSDTLWDTMIVVTNRGTGLCTLQGVSKLELYSGGDGRPLGIKEVTTDGIPQGLVTLNPGEKASMAVVVPTAPEPVPADCLEGASFAEVTLPGDTKSIEAWLPDRSKWMPAVCGAVQVGPWIKGDNPGDR